MSDIDGKDAFEMLLDRIADVIGEKQQIQTQKYEADSALSMARLELDRQTRDACRLRAEVEQLTAKEKKALPVLAELHQAANDILGLVSPGTEGGYRMKDRLKKALKEAGPFCDEIPF